MPTPHARRAAPAVLAALTVLPLLLTGCGDDDTPSSAAREAASAAESLASRAGEAFASATAEAGRTLDSIKGGVEATGDVKAGTPTTDADGRSAVEVTATNTTDAARSFAVQVNFTDTDDKWQDTVLVTVSDVPPGKTGTASARSTHKLSGEVRAEVARAVRY